MINPLHTPCKSCAFAEYIDKTQTGCSLGFIDIYKRQGAEILEVYDNDLEFYVINEKKCIGYRENSWFKQYDLADASISDKIIKFKELNKINYLLVINFKKLGETEEDIKNIKTALESLTVHPQKIVFVRSASGDHTTTYGSINKMMIDAKINCAWRIQSMLDETISNENILHDIISLNKSYRFICSLNNSKCNDLNNLIETAQHIVYDKLEQFSVLTDKERSCIIFPGGVYRYSIAQNGVDLLADTNTYTVI
ncbi:hypothetical protein EBS40_02295 [bacterium]|nr:hypothetical protein [bacterium]